MYFDLINKLMSLVRLGNAYMTESGVTFEGLDCFEWGYVDCAVPNVAKYENIELIFNLFWKKTIIPKILSVRVVDDDKNVKKKCYH